MKSKTRYQNLQGLKKQNQYLIEDLLSLTDPFVQGRLASYKKAVEKDTGPNFLQRMLRDLAIRGLKNQVINKKISFEAVKNEVKNSQDVLLTDEDENKIGNFIETSHKK